MARAAATGAVEIGLTSVRIANDDVEELVEATVGIEIDRGMQKGGEVGHLRVGHVEFRHAAIRPPDAEKRAKLLAAFVLLDDDRTREIRTARPAARVRAVAEAAVLDEQRFPALDRRMVRRRSQRLLLRHGNRRTKENRGDRKARKENNRSACSARSAVDVFAHAQTLPQKARFVVR